MLSKKILSQINSPFIVKLYYSFQDKENLYFILEFVKEEIYFFYWKKKKRLSENMTKFYSAQIVLAIDYLHSNNMIYVI